MAKVGARRAGGSRRGRGQRRAPTWEISDSDTEGPACAEANSEAVARARDPAEQRRAAAEALRLLRPEQAVRRLVVQVDPGAPRGPRSCTSAGARALEAPLNYWEVVLGPLRGERGICQGRLLARNWRRLPNWRDCLKNRLGSGPDLRSWSRW